MSAVNSAHRTCSVGLFLREGRESKGIALEEAARVTRIGKNYLTALEAGTYEILPSTAYVKGFLRAYAEFLGLSGDEIVAMYENSLSPPQRHPEEEKGIDGVPASGKMPASRRGRWVVPVILLACVIVAAYIFDDNGPKPDKHSLPLIVPPAPQGTAAVLPAPSSSQSRTETVEVIADPKKGDISPGGTEPHDGGIVLRLKVNQDSWLNITIDDAVSQQYDLKAGDLIEWKGDKVFALDLGNAGGIEAEINGKPLSPFGETGKPAHVVLKAAGLSP